MLGLGPGPVRRAARRTRCGSRTPTSRISRADGHRAQRRAGGRARSAGATVLVQSGRFHHVRGPSARRPCALPVRVFAALGVEHPDAHQRRRAASGGASAPGTVMLIADHINLTFRNPLIGPVLPGEERFPDMSDPYDAALRALAREVARAAQDRRWRKGSTSSCWARATRRRPRSGCWSGWAPTRSGCPPWSR